MKRQTNSWAEAFLRTYTMPFAFLGISTALSISYTLLLSPRSRASLDLWASTNLANLHSHPLEAMLASPFLGGPAPWGDLALTTVALFLLTARLDNLPATVIVGSAQTLGSLISQYVTELRIASGSAPDSLRTATDIGPSYVLVAALSALVVAGRKPVLRIGSLGTLAALSPGLFADLGQLTVPAIGHTVALVVGVLLAIAIPNAGRRRARGNDQTVAAHPPTARRPAGRPGPVTAPRARSGPESVRSPRGGPRC
ncbi:hypothetical protein P3T39_000517 [Kitasatospora sp. GP82]|nr:hypothetical protein [Kitasatospora sp. GP82]